MECQISFSYSWLDFIFTVTGGCTLLFDVGSDLWVAKDFYVHGDFFWFGIWIGLMFVSSIVVQVFSWLWFKYDRDLELFKPQTFAESVLFSSKGCFQLSDCLHVFQLGLIFRHVSAIWQGFCVWWRRTQGSEYAVYMTHDLSMLRLIKTFWESTPQLGVMVYIMFHNNWAGLVQGVSVVASTTSIAWMVVDYHRSLRSFLPDKAQQPLGSSVVYFLWNLLLIAPRVCSLALFASVLPWFVPVHFLCLWLPLVFWAWRQQTSFMDSPGGEWLYQATVGVVWYFSWFCVSEGRTMWRATVYHSFMVADGVILLGTWWWYRDPQVSEPYALWLVIALPLTYLLGLLLKVLYYSCCHPTLHPPASAEASEDVPDLQATFRSLPDSGPLQNKRMAVQAGLFFGAGLPLPSARHTNGNQSHNAL